MAAYARNDAAITARCQEAARAAREAAQAAGKPADVVAAATTAASKGQWGCVRDAHHAAYSAYVRDHAGTPDDILQLGAQDAGLDAGDAYLLTPVDVARWTQLGAAYTDDGAGSAAGRRRKGSTSSVPVHATVAVPATPLVYRSLAPESRDTLTAMDTAALQAKMERITAEVIPPLVTAITDGHLSSLGAVHQLDLQIAADDAAKALAQAGAAVKALQASPALAPLADAAAAGIKSLSDTAQAATAAYTASVDAVGTLSVTMVNAAVQTAERDLTASLAQVGYIRYLLANRVPMTAPAPVVDTEPAPVVVDTEPAPAKGGKRAA